MANVVLPLPTPNAIFRWKFIFSCCRDLQRWQRNLDHSSAQSSPFVHCSQFAAEHWNCDVCKRFKYVECCHVPRDDAVKTFCADVLPQMQQEVFSMQSTFSMRPMEHGLFLTYTMVAKAPQPLRFLITALRCLPAAIVRDTD